ncbi:MAG: hypothetical protein AAB482_03470 [Patescibacteria group bacterium]
MKRFIIASLALLPFSALAFTAQSGALTEVTTFIQEAIIPFLIVIATLVFLFGIIRYVTAGGDEEKTKQGRNLMIFGIIALAVMISVWGIVKFVVQATGFGDTAIPGGIGDQSGFQ